MDARELPPRPHLDQYRKQAKDLLRACRSGDPEALGRARKSHPRLRRLPDADLPTAGLALADAQWIVAREHGFESWPKFARHVKGLARRDPRVAHFEAAADAVVTGDLDALRSLLRASPALVRARSAREHRSTLLHYVSANGVEDFRQKTPGNAVEVAETLLGAGAEVDAVSDAYDGWSTPLELLVSSVHPARAGLQVALADTLLDHGAAIDGIAGDGSPLMTALAFHYPEAAEALARRGARVDNVIAAAGLGREELVGSFLDAGGSLRPEVPLSAVRWLRLPADPRAHLRLALVWAAGLGRTGVVDLLLRKGVDPGARDARRFTALHWAAHYGHPETVRVLLERGAPLETRNGYGGTVLDQAIWASLHDPQVGDYAPVVERLVAAGAKVEGRYPSGDERIDAVLARNR